MEKKKPGCLANIFAFIILIVGMVYFINSCVTKSVTESSRKADEKPSENPIRDEKPAPKIVQDSIEQKQSEAMTDEEHKAESAKRTAKTKKDCCDLLYELMEFRKSKEFAIYGFGAGGPFNAWKKRVEELRGNAISDFRKKFLSGELSSAPGYILELGFEYMKTHGEESEYTKTVLPDLKKAIGYESYLKKKNKSAKKKKKSGN